MWHGFCNPFPYTPTYKTKTMKKLLFIFCLLSPLVGISQIHNNKKSSLLKIQIEGKRWQIQNQSFASHDINGTDIDSISGLPGDYIDFKSNGLVYTFFDGKYDTMEYKLIGKDSISFGDTPFLITKNGLNSIQLYQNEEEPNGDYNRVIYRLISDRKEELLQTNNKD